MYSIPRVEQMETPSGSPAPNQFKIFFKDGVAFQSYNSIVAVKYDDGRIELGRYCDYSTTTGKYRNQFLGEGIKETRRKLEEGIYTLNEEL